jgi:alcohol dehydrogenase (cytochrome c)
MPHDTHDWDAAEVPVLVDAELDGVERKLLMQASRNGYFAVLDRETGKNLLTRPFARVNWAERIASDGRPIPDPDKEPAPDGRLVSPDEGGGTNYRSPSLDPEEGLLIVSAADAFGLYFWKPEHGDYGWAGASPGVYSHGYIRAIDFRTGEIRWEKDLHGGAGAAGVLTTATGVTFTGDSASSAVALRTRDGATLWHSRIGRVGNSPITYELDGRQYVIFGGGDSVYAFVMPQRLVAD